jgi:hypothetical protein
MALASEAQPCLARAENRDFTGRTRTRKPAVLCHTQSFTNTSSDGSFAYHARRKKRVLNSVATSRASIGWIGCEGENSYIRPVIGPRT